MNRNGEVRIGLGVPSLVLILLVLCLALLGVLSLISARADYSMTFRQAELTAAFAQADAQAQQALASLDDQMVQAWKASSDDAAYAKACAQMTQAGSAAIEWIDEQHAVMKLNAGAERVLSVEVCRLMWEIAGNQRFSVEKYALEDGLAWSQTESLELMGVD